MISPLLFILYINDIQQNIQRNCLLTSYADDTTLIVSDKNNLILEEKCNENLAHLLNWFCNNRLYLNLNKTKYIQFKTSQRKGKSNFDIKINNNKIINTPTHKFLGIIIDENLNWKSQCDHIINSLNSYCYLIKSLKRILNLKQIIIFYQAVIESKLRYGIYFWGSSKCMNDVLISQKRIIRSITGLDRFESCKESFKNLKILTVFGLYIFELCLYTYKNKQKFIMNSQYHTFDTRNRDNIHVDFTSLSLKQNTPDIIGPKFFNKLPNEIKNSKSIKIFKKRLKLYLTPLTIYSISDFK